MLILSGIYYSCMLCTYVCMDIQYILISTSQHGHINFFDARLTQVKILTLTSIRKMLFLSQALTVFRML
jgi:hypothetical protein